MQCSDDSAMDRTMCSTDYEIFYKIALLSREQMQNTVPTCITKLEELQNICRICGCQSNGTFIDLDTNQDFEFEPSISSYRMLFQRTSLQFQFNTMPDMPSCICGTCCNKVKIFYLMTRQFVISQQAMRTTITEWYRKKYDIEPPEQLEDRNQLIKQLALAEANRAKRQPMNKLIKPVKDFIKDTVFKQRPKIKRSISVDKGLNANAQNPNVQTKVLAMNQRVIDNGCQTSRSAANLKYDATKCASTVKKPTSAQKPVMQRTSTQRTICPMVRKKSATKECVVTPRLKQNSKVFDNPHEKDTKFRDQKIGDKGAQKRTVPPSKAQQQKTPKEPIIKWR
ncbi:uncharacterized protein LOC6561994 [Drosophila grimshawi]|uniref:uncharacterized protein LOC6561994 n=1 Tax=Drosophila grimshawi TaxID=7222 RepID=UPI001C936E28|nr:uncharacterized protein LOC6561994 [Drosophila grimshawi]